MSALFDEKDKQIALMKSQQLVSEEKCRTLEEVVRKANTRMSIMMRELTQKQEFINECLKKEELKNYCRFVISRSMDYKKNNWLF